MEREVSAHRLGTLTQHLMLSGKIRGFEIKLKGCIIGWHKASYLSQMPSIENKINIQKYIHWPL